MAASVSFRLTIASSETLDAEGSRRIDSERLLSPGEAVTIGRQEGNDLVLDDQRVSRRHAVIECGDAGCRVTDLGSSNGTYLEGERLQPNVPVDLHPGAELTIGSYSLRVHSEVPSPESQVGLGPAIADFEPPATDSGTPKPEAPAEAAPESKRAVRRPDDAGSARTPPTGSGPPGRGPAEPPIPPGAEDLVPPGLSLRSQRLLRYLPGIYHTDFMARFLGIFEAILTPIEWTVDNFDLFLDPGTAPGGFLPWLAAWFDITFDPSWSEAQRRQLLREAHRLYARRGTRWALSRVLEIYTGTVPTIEDTDPALEPHTFRVTLTRRVAPPDVAHPDRSHAKSPPAPSSPTREMVERLIDAHKPAHTGYALEYEP